MPSQSSRSPLPFEPKKKSKKGSQPTKSEVPPQNDSESAEYPRKIKQSRSSASIPEEVSQRMFRRMLVFSGLPTLVGVAIFFISYFLIVRDIVELPTYAVLLSTLGCFGLGVVGLSYGALSASWDEGRPGSWLGVEELRVNFPRLTGAWGNLRKSGSDDN